MIVVLSHPAFLQTLSEHHGRFCSSVLEWLASFLVLQKNKRWHILFRETEVLKQSNYIVMGNTYGHKFHSPVRSNDRIQFCREEKVSLYN